MDDNSNINLKTTQQELSKLSDDNLWDIAAVYRSNCDRIRKWLEDHARKALTGSITDSAKVQANLQIAMNKYNALSLQLEQLYNIDDMPIDHNLMQKAKDGVFKDAAPSKGTILFWFFILFMSGGLELAFFSYMVMFKGAGPALIGIAIILLVGGLISGYGLNHIMISHKVSEKFEYKYIALFIVGILLITAVVTLRAIYGGVLASVVAGLFGLAVTTAETFWGYNNKLRGHYINQMFKAQDFYAAAQHNKDMGEKNNSLDDTWRTEYQTMLESIARTIITSIS